MKPYRYADLRVTARAVRCSRGFHLLRVLLIGAHNIALGSIVGVVPPMEPAIEWARSAGRRHVCISRGGGGIQHTGMRVVAGATPHSSHCSVQPLNFGDVWGNVGDGSGGWRGSEGNRAVGTPLRVPVLRMLLLLLLLLRFLLLLLLLLLALLFERPAVALGCRAGERGGRVAADEVVAQCLQVWKQGCQALLQYRGVREVVPRHGKRNRGETRHSFKEGLEITEVGFPLTAPCQTLTGQQE